MKKIKPVLMVLLISAVASVFLNATYMYGYFQGHNTAIEKTQLELDSLITQFQNRQISVKPVNSPAPTNKPVVTNAPAPKIVSWGGPELWEAVNKRRIELGVNPLGQRDEICTVASIRLNQLLELGKLDGHEGFSTLPDERPDLQWIYEKYTLTEFLISGANSPADAVTSWEHTLAHKKLLTGGEYVWGCIYAQNTFAVAITAY